MILDVCAYLSQIRMRLRLAGLGVVLLGTTPAFAAPPPPGPYHDSCENTSVEGTTLNAECKDFFGNLKKTSLPDIANCHSSIQNINGDLRCVIGENHVGGSHAAFFDIFSISKDEIVNGAQTKVFRIDQPRVWEASTSLPMISFKPGDRISFNAGGCVQTGGSGRTWKSFVFPDGNNAPDLYAGTAWIPGVIGDFARLGGLIWVNPAQKPRVPKVWTVPDPKNPELLSQYFLRLGYQDDNLSDNGYYSHDDGNDDQCKDVGPAWVEVTVVSRVDPRPIRAAGPQWSPGTQPFDLIWDINNEDFNGLPLNPRWFSQLSDPKSEPNFRNTCGPAFHDDSVIDLTKLNQICTTGSPTADFYGLGPGRIKCPDEPLKGHLNWMIATYTGNIAWQEWSGTWPSDNDVNMLLTRSGDNIGQTSENAQFPGIVIEFDGGETWDFMSNWWHSLRTSAIPMAPPGPGKPPPLPKGPTPEQMMNGLSGLPGVVIGLVGIDGVHEGYTESHPAFAMALQVSNAPLADGSQEDWTFFLRNQGDEGGCSSYIHNWDSPTGDYFIQLPWPSGAASVSVPFNQVNSWPGSDPKMNVSILQSAEPGFTIIKIHATPGLAVGVDGLISLKYTFPAGPKPRMAERALPRDAAIPTVNHTPELEWEDVAVRIQDSGVKERFEQSLLALNPPKAAVTNVPHPLTVDPVVGIQYHVPGPASRGVATRARAVPNLPKQKLDNDAEHLAQTFKDMIGPAPVRKK